MLLHGFIPSEEFNGMKIHKTRFASSWLVEWSLKCAKNIDSTTAVLKVMSCEINKWKWLRWLKKTFTPPPLHAAMHLFKWKIKYFSLLAISLFSTVKAFVGMHHVLWRKNWTHFSFETASGIVITPCRF